MGLCVYPKSNNTYLLLKSKVFLSIKKTQTYKDTFKIFTNHVCVPGHKCLKNLPRKFYRRYLRCITGEVK